MGIEGSPPSLVATPVLRPIRMDAMVRRRTKKRKRPKMAPTYDEPKESPEIAYFNEQYLRLADCFPLDISVFIHKHFDDISDFMPLLKHKYRFCQHLHIAKELNDYGGLLKIIYATYPQKYDAADLYDKFCRYRLPVEWFAKEIGSGIFIKPYVRLQQMNKILSEPHARKKYRPSFIDGQPAYFTSYDSSFVINNQFCGMVKMVSAGRKCYLSNPLIFK